MVSADRPCLPSCTFGKCHNDKTDHRSRRRFARLGVLAVLAAVAYYVSPLLGSIPWLPSENVDYTATIGKIRQLQSDLLERWPYSWWASHRDFTIEALDRFATCLEHNTCGPGEKTVVLLGSFHFGNSQNGHTSGEDIWAGSIVNILQSHNYTLLYTYHTLETLLVYKALSEFIPLVIYEAGNLEECMKLGTMTREEATAAEIDGIEFLEPGEPMGCAKRIGYEDGIPLAKVKAYHFWTGKRHPFTGWTLAPYNQTLWHGDWGNFHLGYHLEHCRHVKPAATKIRRAFVLGKKAEYFSPQQFAWPQGIFEEMTAAIGDGFQFVGGAGQKGVDDMPMKGIENLGLMVKEEWNEEVSKSAVMIGVGPPPLSPSPYDALCLGTPFINPVLARDEKNPDNMWAWQYHSQHNGLRELGPPYVYHVWKHDKEGLEKALKAAIANPIKPFIPDSVKRETVERKVLYLVNTNWTAEGEAYIQKGNDLDHGFVDTERGLNLENGFLL